MSVTDIPGPRYFGDESGNFRGLLQGNEQYFGVAVVKGTAIDCARCPKRAVRRANSVDEARWTDLTDTQRRRIASCIQSVDGIDGAYVLIERDDIHRIPNNYVLQQDSLPYDNDMVALAGFYGTAISELGIQEQSYPQFTFDRCISRSASNQVCDLLEEVGFEGNIEHRASQAVRGIQLADCVIGAAASDTFDGTNYLDNCNVSDISSYGLVVLEKTLSDQKAEP